jgi:hypothetical protein
MSYTLVYLLLRRNTHGFYGDSRDCLLQNFAQKTSKEGSSTKWKDNGAERHKVIICGLDLCVVLTFGGLL